MVSAATEGRTIRIPAEKLPQDRAFRLVVIAPDTDAELTLEKLVFKAATGSAVAWARWDWSTQTASWEKHGSAWSELAVAYPRDLSTLPDAAKPRSARWVAIEGDPAMILEAERDPLVARISALTELPPAWRPDGIQLDIEPYLLPGYSQHPAYWNGQWKLTLEAAHQAAKGLPLEAVLPWWLLQSEAGRAFLDGLPGSVEGVVVMNYRTDPMAALQTASAWREWGARVGLPVAIGCELGPLPSESIQRLDPAESGPLWMVELPELGTLALWFDGPVGSETGGRVYAPGGPPRARAGGVSFHDRPDAALPWLRAMAALPASQPEQPRPLYLHEPPADFSPPSAN